MDILLVEDDLAAADLLKESFAARGHRLSHADNGAEGLRLAQAQNYDVLVVDRMLPEMDGLSLVRHLRETGHQVPVLFLSALGEVEDRIAGLKAGGDDYLIKPYVFEELHARLEALTRRGGDSETKVTLGDLTLDRLERRVTRAGQEIDLQKREFELLDFLLQHQGQTVTRNMLLEHVWGFDFAAQTNVIDVHISRLRGKIDKDFDTPLLHTLRGVGFVMKWQGYK